MKKLILALSLVSVASLSIAHEGFRHHGYRGGVYYGGNSWIAPVLIGGVIGYELSRAPVYSVPPPVVYTQPGVIVQQPPTGYHWQEMIDPVTSQTKIVLVPN